MEVWAFIATGICGVAVGAVFQKHGAASRIGTDRSIWSTFSASGAGTGDQNQAGRRRYEENGNDLFHVHESPAVRSQLLEQLVGVHPSPVFLADMREAHLGIAINDEG